MLDAPFAQFGLAIFRSVRPPLHGNRERGQVLPGVVRSKDGRIRQTRSRVVAFCEPYCWRVLTAVLAVFRAGPYCPFFLSVFDASGIQRSHYVRLPASGAPVGRLLRGSQRIDFDFRNKPAKGDAGKPISFLPAVFQYFFDGHPHALGHVLAFSTIQLRTAFHLERPLADASLLSRRFVRITRSGGRATLQHAPVPRNPSDPEGASSHWDDRQRRS
jgi:hypothetical protein